MTFTRRVLAPVIFGALLLLTWQLFVDLRDIPGYLLPSPSAIGTQVKENFSDILSSSRASGTNALVGLIAGILLGLLAAVIAAWVPLIERLLTPLAAAVSAMPIVALAPVLSIMFSATSDLPRRIVVAVVAFFPVFVTTVRGLTRIDPVHAELMRSYAAGGWDLTRVIRLPGAVPYLFTGVRVASSLAVISAVVAEYFGGLQNGSAVESPQPPRTRPTPEPGPTSSPRSPWGCCSISSRSPLSVWRPAVVSRAPLSRSEECREKHCPPSLFDRSGRRSGHAGPGRLQHHQRRGLVHRLHLDRWLTPVKLQLQWFTQAQFAGYFAAVDQASTRTRGSTSPSWRVGSTSCRRPYWPRAKPISPSPGYRRHWPHANSAGITDVAQVYQRSGTRQVSFKDKNITTAADLKGKKVGNWGFGNEFELFAG